jgi:hypothetical protein
MTLKELIIVLERILTEHPDLADRNVLNSEGDYTIVKVHNVTSEEMARGYVKGLMVG